MIFYERVLLFDAATCLTYILSCFIRGEDHAFILQTKTHLLPVTLDSVAKSWHKAVKAGCRSPFGRAYLSYRSSGSHV